MYVTTKRLDATTLRACARYVGADLYGGNVSIDVEHIGGNRYRLKLGAHDSHGPGARASWSGRHGPWACWHVFRDVLAAIFYRDPEATVRTSLATYRGAAGFLAEFPRTADHNVGSLVRPAYMPDLCECDSPDDGGEYVERVERRVLAEASIVLLTAVS